MATRKNVVIDEVLLEKVKNLYGISTTDAAIDFALRMATGQTEQKGMLDLEGAGWDVALDELRPETNA